MVKISNWNKKILIWYCESKITKLNTLEISFIKKVKYCIIIAIDYFIGKHYKLDDGI